MRRVARVVALLLSVVLVAMAVGLSIGYVSWYSSWVPTFAKFDGRDVPTSEYVWGIARGAAVVTALLVAAGVLFAFARFEPRGGSPTPRAR